MKIIKFGGKSLANGNGYTAVLNIIQEKYKQGEIFYIVVSARGQATDQLLDLADKAKNGLDYSQALHLFIEQQCKYCSEQHLTEEIETIKNTLKGISLLRDCSKHVENIILAQGELLSAKTLVQSLKTLEIPAQCVDARKILKTFTEKGEDKLNLAISEQNTKQYFRSNFKDEIAVITGFIASNQDGETTTLGRNGSNYSAAIFADFLNVEKVENFTHVDGIFSANLDWVPEAKIINNLSFQEANELANFGTSILHPKTILPLVKKGIQLEVKNTFNASKSGTLISAKVEREGIKAISVQENIGIIEVSGHGFYGQSGVDARIFNALSKFDISVGLVSQGSSECGISLLVDLDKLELAKEVLDKAFYHEIQSKSVQPIAIRHQVGLISIVGHGIEYFHKPFQSLIKNGVQPLLINNTLNGNTVGLVVEKNDLRKAVHLIHSQIFGVDKVVNLAVIGKGTVGSVFIDQCISNVEALKKKRNTEIRIFALATSQALILDTNGIDKDWRNQFTDDHLLNHDKHQEYIVDFAKKHHLENLILIDNTASTPFAKTYEFWVNNGFNLVSSNKIANTLDIANYQNLRSTLAKNKKKYLYETNVGAGLPLIDTLRLLHDSGENITRIRGVFSGSLSYIFNTFSENKTPFGEVLNNAVSLGFTEPDPREDLCGNDVARKLLILARELDLENEFDDVEVQNLIPTALQTVDSETFFSSFNVLDDEFEEIKKQQKEGHVLRYVGELFGDLQQTKAQLKVSLVSVPSFSALGQVKGSDSIVEIFTESYGDQPIVIQGAGAGAKVTARGVLGDVLRLAESL